MSTTVNNVTRITLWVIMSLSLIVLGFSFSQINSWFQSEGGYSAVLNPDNSTDEELAYRHLQEAGGDDVNIVITDGPLNCALWDKNHLGIPTRNSNSDGEEVKNGGCWRSNTPDTIYISSSLGSGESLRYVTLHEYAHVLQNRGEVPTQHLKLAPDMPAEESLECLADVETFKKEFDENQLTYFKAGKCEAFRSLLVR